MDGKKRGNAVKIPRTAFVLAAGLGTRMRPLTDNLPKPLIEVHGRSIIDRALDKLADIGVTRAIINVHYLPEMLIDHLSRRRDIEIIFSREEVRLETAGGILNAIKHISDDPIYVISSDVVWEDAGKPALLKLAENWNDDLVALLALQRVKNSYGYDGQGDFNMTKAGELSWREEGMEADFVFTGLQILCPKIFRKPDIIALGNNFALNKIYRAYLSQIKGIENEGKWYHIGTPQALSGLPPIL